MATKGLLDKLFASDTGKTFVVSPDAFEKALEQEGLVMGEKNADDIVMQCRVTKDGKIDYTRLAQATLRKNDLSAIGTLPSTSPGESSPAASGLAQKDLVIKLSGKIRQIYKHFDLGLIGPDKFCEQVEALGLNRTPAFNNLMRHGSYDLTYNQLMKALGSEETGFEDFFAGVSADFEEKCVHKNRKLHVATPTKVDKHTIFDTDPEEYAEEHRYKRNPLLCESRGVKAALEYIPDEARFLTSTMAAQHGYGAASYLHPEDVQSEEFRSAFLKGHPATKLPMNVSILRQQVYCSIKELDAGHIDVPTFVKQLKYLGIEIPPEVSRLLVKTNSNGQANFGLFVRAFEPILRVREEELLTLSPARRANPQPTTLPQKQRELRMAELTHGDFITWRSEPGELEQREMRMNHQARKPAAATNDTYAGHPDILKWCADEAKMSEYEFPTETIISWNEKSEAQPPAPPYELKRPYGTDL